MTLPVAMPSPGIKGGQQVQRPIAPRLLFDPIGEPRRRGLRGLEPRPGLHGGFCSEAEDHLLGLAGAGVEGEKGSPLGRAGRSAGILRREPPMMPPWFELRMGEKPADR
jgi:hypothetical protein